MSSTVVPPSCMSNDKPVVFAVNADDLKKGMLVTNMGVVDGITRAGVFVVAAIRGTLWSTGIGKGDIVIHDVVWHESEMITVDQL